MLFTVEQNQGTRFHVDGQPLKYEVQTKFLTRDKIPYAVEILVFSDERMGNTAKGLTLNDLEFGKFYLFTFGDAKWKLFRGVCLFKKSVQSFQKTKLPDHDPLKQTTLFFEILPQA